MTALKIIFVLTLLLSCKISAGYILHHAGFMTYEGEYYGSQAKISAWGISHMNPNSHYEVSITLLNLDGDHVRLIKAGFHVFPKLYHNNDLRFFTSANDDASRNYACYNMNNSRPAFIVTNSSVLYSGQAIAPLSQYNGEDRSVTLSIKKDSITEFWTLYREDFGTSSKIGWWEKEFLGNLDNKTANVQWMAFVAYENNDTGPSMGSGHYPNEGKNKAAYIMDLKLFDKVGKVDSPTIVNLVGAEDKPDCYRALPDVFVGGIEVNDHKFYYGGPAGCRN